MAGGTSQCAAPLRDQRIISRSLLRRGRNRRGQALVEFAVVCLVVYMLLAAILTFGQMLYSAQTLQQAADVAARELSRTPLSPTADLMDVLYANTGYDGVRASVFDQSKLQVNLTTELGSDPSVLDAINKWPIVNQMLFPVMIVVQPVAGGDKYLVYPGVVPCTDSAGRTVPCIAQVVSRSAGGVETITWVPIIEEVTPGAFSVVSLQRGLVALRINYPYQSATMSGFQPLADPGSSPGPGNPLNPIEANDSGVTVNSNQYTPTGCAAPVGMERPLRRKLRARAAVCLDKDRQAVPESDFGPSHLSARGVSIAQQPIKHSSENT